MLGSVHEDYCTPIKITLQKGAVIGRGMSPAGSFNASLVFCCRIFPVSWLARGIGDIFLDWV